ncbi:MAG: methyltransferase domain-containing protein [Saprospiraceae bacterium]|uniref:Methyltransferase domain-containing protein n=1 Tax=Candidatus Defluviibacterium haderslevense TaxID=2981993 RepID=A0A9D7XGF4_9BACT|nr:methyltransferase domain-containing protein [Candidatus Defluviibacterium haderslevense]MBL0236035.1 methyltransferase domain-containing protein [Candidatus Defluviibacterium haderslevense]
MNQTEIKDWEKRTGHLSKVDLLQLAMVSEIRIYENDLPKGGVLDIGIGLGSEAIYFSEKGRKVFAVDKEVYFLDRIKEISKNNIVAFESKMPEGILPNETFALVILSNILHFLNYSDSISVCNKITKLMVAGSFALVRVHSKKHPYSKLAHEKNAKFKHFFSSKEVKELFPSKNFEMIFFSTYQRKFSSKEVAIMGLENGAINFKDGYTMIVKKK